MEEELAKFRADFELLKKVKMQWEQYGNDMESQTAKLKTRAFSAEARIKELETELRTEREKAIADSSRSQEIVSNLINEMKVLRSQLKDQELKLNEQTKVGVAIKTEKEVWEGFSLILMDNLSAAYETSVDEYEQLSGTKWTRSIVNEEVQDS